MFSDGILFMLGIGIGMVILYFSYNFLVAGLEWFDRGLYNLEKWAERKKKEREGKDD